MSTTTIAELTVTDYARLSDPWMEGAVLAGSTVNPELARQAALVMTPAHFTTQRGRAHWQAISKCLQDGIQVNRLSVFAAAQALRVADVVTMGYLAEVDDDVPFQISGFDGWLQHVHDRHIRRRLVQATKALEHRACDTNQPIASILEHANRITADLAGEARQRADLVGVGDVIEEAGGADAFFGPQRLERVTPTPHWSVQQRFIGFQPESYVILAGRPSLGKSALALQWAMHAAKLGRRVVFYSLEMSKEMLVQRLVALEGRIPLQKIIRGEMDSTDRRAAEQAMVRIHESGFRMAYSPEVSVPAMYSQIARMPDKPDLVIVDYLQLIRGGSSRATRNEVISEISRGLKLAAMEFGACMIALSQLSRPVREGAESPQLHHLRDSGSLEQDADAVFFVHGAEAQKIKAERQVELLIAKQRNGEVAKVPLVFRGAFQRFDEPKPAPDNYYEPEQQGGYGDE